MSQYKELPIIRIGDIIKYNDGGYWYLAVVVRSFGDGTYVLRDKKLFPWFGQERAMRLIFDSSYEWWNLIVKTNSETWGSASIEKAASRRIIWRLKRGLGL